MQHETLSLDQFLAPPGPQPLKVTFPLPNRADLEAQIVRVWEEIAWDGGGKKEKGMLKKRSVTTTLSRTGSKSITKIIWESRTGLADVPSNPTKITNTSLIPYHDGEIQTHQDIDSGISNLQPCLVQTLGWSPNANS